MVHPGRISLSLPTSQPIAHHVRARGAITAKLTPQCQTEYQKGRGAAYKYLHYFESIYSDILLSNLVISLLNSTAE